METILEFLPLYELKQKHSLTDYCGFELGLWGLWLVCPMRHRVYFVKIATGASFPAKPLAGFSILNLEYYTKE